MGGAGPIDFHTLRNTIKQCIRPTSLLDAWIDVERENTGVGKQERHQRRNSPRRKIG